MRGACGAATGTAAAGCCFGTGGSAGGLFFSSCRSLAAYAVNCFARTAEAASFVRRAAEPRWVVRATATAPRTAAPASSRATTVTWNLCMPPTLGRRDRGQGQPQASLLLSRSKGSANPDARGGVGRDTRNVQILVVEDEDAIADPLVSGLRREGYDVSRVATGEGALQAAPADLVLLDLRLPDLDGLDVCRRLREHSRVPIIVLTARGEEADRVVGLELGADDYVVKPYGLRELIARIRAVMRRAASPIADGGPLRVGPLEVDERARRATLDGRELELTPKEFDLLAALARDPGAAVSRQRLLAEVWQTSWYGSAKTIDVHVAALRKKLGDPGWIETVRSVGFRLGEP
jgi:two-component system, OmpR family, response regulator RegX3